MRRFYPLLSLLLAPLVAGCDNPCQALCEDMATYAEECGLTVSIDDVSACKDQFDKGGLTEADIEQCRLRSDADALQEWWTCDDLAANFQNGAGGAAAAE